MFLNLIYKLVQSKQIFLFSFNIQIQSQYIPTLKMFPVNFVQFFLNKKKEIKIYYLKFFSFGLIRYFIYMYLTIYYFFYIFVINHLAYQLKSSEKHHLCRSFNQSHQYSNICASAYIFDNNFQKVRTIKEKLIFSGEFIEKEESWNDANSSTHSINDELDRAAIESSDHPESSHIDYSKSVEDIIADIESVDLSNNNNNSNSNSIEETVKAREVKFNEANLDTTATSQLSYKRVSPFQPNKQHTGLKNNSSNVGAAVAPSGKMEFDQEAPESFGVVKIGRPIGRSQLDNSDAMSTISSVNSEGLTDQGYFDLKFYHNKLW